MNVAASNCSLSSLVSLSIGVYTVFVESDGCVACVGPPKLVGAEPNVLGVADPNAPGVAPPNTFCVTAPDWFCMAAPEAFCMAAPEDKFSAVAPKAPGADPSNVPDDPPKIGCAPPNVSWLVVAGLPNRPVLCCSDTIPPPNTLLVVVAGLPNNPVPAELPPNVPKLPAPLGAPNSPVVGLVEGLPAKVAFDGVDPNKPG